MSNLDGETLNLTPSPSSVGSAAPYTPSNPPAPPTGPLHSPYTACQRTQKILARLLCVLVALGQAVAMDAFLASDLGNNNDNNNQFFFLFVIIDILVAVVITVTMVTNYRFITAIRRGATMRNEEGLDLSLGTYFLVSLISLRS